MDAIHHERRPTGCRAYRDDVDLVAFSHEGLRLASDPRIPRIFSVGHDCHAEPAPQGGRTSGTLSHAPTPGRVGLQRLRPPRRTLTVPERAPSLSTVGGTRSSTRGCSAAHSLEHGALRLRR